MYWFSGEASDRWSVSPGPDDTYTASGGGDGFTALEAGFSSLVRLPPQEFKRWPVEPHCEFLAHRKSGGTDVAGLVFRLGPEDLGIDPTEWEQWDLQTNGLTAFRLHGLPGYAGITWTKRGGPVKAFQPRREYAEKKDPGEGAIDLLGQFGRNAQAPARPDPPTADARPQDKDDGLTGLLGSFTAPSGAEPQPSPTPHEATGDEEPYLAVATSPPAGWRIEPGEPGHFGFGWHAGSQHDAGTAAVAECRSQGGGSACAFDAGGTSLRGGCVGLALAGWRDRDEDPERAYVVTGSSFRNLIAGDLRSGCEREAFGGKREGTVVEHACGIVRIMCADDVAPPLH